MRRSPNITTFVTGIALAVLGVLLVLEQRGQIELGFAYMAPALIAGVGVALLASGLTSRRRPRG